MLCTASVHVPTDRPPCVVSPARQRVRGGSIIVLHVNGRGVGTEGAVPAIVAGLRARGFKPVTVSSLLRACATWPNVYLCVCDFNHRARHFYRQLGYEEVGVLRDQLIVDAGEVLMRKTVGVWRGYRSRTSIGAAP